MTTDDLASRVRRLEAKDAITELLTRYTIAVDEYDIDAVAELFTDDCVTDYGPGRGGLVVGRDDVRARIRRGQSEFRLTHHQHGQVLITFTDDATATVVSYLTAWHERWNGARERVRLRYLDRVVDTAAGWRIAERRVVASGVEGFDGVEWVWVERATPDEHG
ncbi:MAG: nuclear transport factor 2 family protein [Actinobacteria bacterium]|nr:nuclear transport factor 2 family protein [Actinomycetota bacterium]